MKLIFAWKKVLECDLEHIVSELESVMNIPATIILSGDVGAGKTTFSKYFIGQIDKTDLSVQSPSYSVVNEFDRVVHADFYRLKDPNELTHLELPLYIEEKDYLLVEWGRPYLRELKRIIGDDFSLYELQIEINDSVEHSEDEPLSRNYLLYQLDL